MEGQVRASDGAGKMGEQAESSPDSEEARKASHMVLHSNFLQLAGNRILEQKAASMELSRWFWLDGHVSA